MAVVGRLAQEQEPAQNEKQYTKQYKNTEYTKQKIKNNIKLQSSNQKITKRSK